jgi:hypothetical protein
MSLRVSVSDLFAGRQACVSGGGADDCDEIQAAGAKNTQCETSLHWVSLGFVCPWCGGGRLLETQDGLTCSDCWGQAYAFTDWSIVQVGYQEVAIFDAPNNDQQPIEAVKAGHPMAQQLFLKLDDA